MEYVRLRDIVSYQKGFAFKSELYSNTGRMVVRVSDFTMESISDDNAVFIEQNDKYKTHELKTGDILIQTVGSWANNPNSIVGKVVRVPSICNKAYLNQNIVKLIPKQSIGNSYLFYSLLANSFSMYCVNRGQGAANQASITLDTILKFKFQIHDIDTQQRIASFLLTYDRLIENNKSRIKLLEQTAENLYKEWFVRFRFPGYENVEMKNGLPKGWKQEKLFDVADVSYGYAFKSDLFCNDNSLNAVVRIRDIQNNATETYTSEECSDKYLIEENAILVGMDGIFHMCLWNGRTAYLNQRVVKINSKLKGICNYFLYMCIRPQVKFWETVISGTTVSHLGDKHLKKMKVLIPSSEILQKADSVIEGIMIEKNKLFKQNQYLAHQRDLLLPRLMSGKLEVKP